ncbi:unnamed protein product [Blepharisma stoltei]|uniref:Uncharacterized protein n=1 Tax=Blepharisma stoltei TaxID=1481888 RepID=A0AAU9JJZ1_9CILI|nr:unnamed protein product [Blepharisma stoltei]
MEINNDNDFVQKSQKKPRSRKKSNFSVLKEKIKHYDAKVKLLEESRKSANQSRCSVKRSSSQPSPKKAHNYSMQMPKQQTEREIDFLALNSIANTDIFDSFHSIIPNMSSSHSVLKKRHLGNISLNLSKIKEKRKTDKENSSPEKVQELKEELKNIREENKILKQHIKHTKESYQDSLDAQRNHYEQELCELKQINKKLLQQIEEKKDTSENQFKCKLEIELKLQRERIYKELQSKISKKKDYLNDERVREIQKELEEKYHCEMINKEAEFEIKVKNRIDSIKSEYDRRMKATNDEINELRKRNSELEKQIKRGDSDIFNEKAGNPKNNPNKISAFPAKTNEAAENFLVLRPFLFEDN